MKQDWRSRAERWLKKKNVEQHVWAIRYLEGKGWFKRPRRADESNYDYLVSHFRNAPDLLKLKEDLRKMKRAWSQKKARDKNGTRKSYSFMMSKKVEYKLRYLAKKHGQPGYKVLETMILSEHWRESTLAWLESAQKSFKKRMDDLERRENDLKRIESNMAENKDALASLYLANDLLIDYRSSMDACLLDKWIIVREGAYPRLPLAFNNATKVKLALSRYESLRARPSR